MGFQISSTLTQPASPDPSPKTSQNKAQLDIYVSFLFVLFSQSKVDHELSLALTLDEGGEVWRQLNCKPSSREV